MAKHEDRIVLQPKGEAPSPRDLVPCGLPIFRYQHEALDRLKEQSGYSKSVLLQMAVDEFIKRVEVVSPSQG